MDSIIAAIDAEISRLKQVRTLLSQSSGAPSSAPPSKRGRKSGPAGAKKAGGAPKKRVLSPEARKAIADAQRKRWAAAKKAAK